MSNDSDLISLWSSVRCGFITQDQQDIIVIQADEKIANACKILADNGISSAPVYDSKNNSYSGMLEYGDLVALVLAFKNKHELPEGSDILEHMIQEGAQLSIPAKLAVDLSSRNPFTTLMPESTLLNAMQCFASGTRRIVVMGGNGKLDGIISQTTALRFIHAHLLDQLETYTSKTVGALEIGSHPVISVGANRPVMEAMQLMDQHKISSVALLDDDGTLCGNMSLSDIKLIFKKKTLSLLHHSCRSYISTIRQEEIKNLFNPEASEAKWPYWSVSTTTPLKFVIMKMAATKSHHLFVTDQTRKPLRVISVGDVIRILTPKSD